MFAGGQPRDDRWARGLVNPQQVRDVRMRAETAVANADAVLRTEDGRHLRVCNPGQGERADANPIRVGPQAMHGQPGDGGKTSLKARQEMTFMVRDDRHAAAWFTTAGGVQR